MSVFLLISVAIMGCSSDSGSSAPAPTGTVTTATPIGPLYTAGDIVASSSNPATGWLIISYDSAKDSYTRAFIYKNSNGSWGYRINSDTETASRKVMEKVYAVKVTHVSVSSIPTAAPTTVRTTTITTRETTARTTTVTTTIARAPSFRSMDPDKAYAGNSVTTTITGANFVATPTVKLTRSGSSNIEATSVVWNAATQLTCTFTIPNTTTASTWNVLITNPDGQTSGTSGSNYFMVHKVTED
ncbi:MAG TPA: hypothetical protein PKM50_03395 [Methanoregula sp.]|nr:hypothetical protein [Methanoregula sp.]